LQMIQNYKEKWKDLHAIVKYTTTNHWMCWGLLWMYVEIKKLSTD
jgi:hypothetical protein